MKRLLLILGCVAGVAGSVEAELWTNAAGRVMEAQLEQFDGATVTLIRTNGSRLTLPLTALSGPDRQRVKLQTGRSVLPAFVQGAYRDARTVLDRFAALPAERRTPEARAAAVRSACAVFDARLKPRAGELNAPELQAEIKRLRNALETNA